MGEDASCPGSARAPLPPARRILFFGWGAAAGRVLDELAVYAKKGACLVHCVSHLSQAADCDLQEVCKRHSFDCSLFDTLSSARLSEANAEIFALAQGFAPDLIMSSSYRAKLKADVLNLCADSINFHPSLLPRHRGCMSGFWAIFEGDSETGVTCHRMVEAFDEGRLLHQERQAITSDDTSVSIYKKLLPVTALCASNVLRLYFGPGLPLGDDQNGDSSYHFRKLPFDGLIQPEWSDDQVQRFIRAMHFPPFDGAAVFLNDERFLVESVTHLHTLRRRAELSAELPPCKKASVLVAVVSEGPS